MAEIYSTQVAETPLYLSPQEVQAMLEIDRRGISKAKPEALHMLEALANCLATEAINFATRHPHTTTAGLCLKVHPLLPVYEPRRE